MVVMKKQTLLIVAIILVAWVGCKSKKVTTAAFHSYATECLGKSLDGCQVLRVWASGRNRSDAIEQAMKKAVHDIVFTGVQAGSGECNAYPIVSEANASKKYEDYFGQFFIDGGAYKEYVLFPNKQKSAMQVYYGDGTQMVGIIVTVDRSALQQRFISDKIIIK